MTISDIKKTTLALAVAAIMVILMASPLAFAQQQDKISEQNKKLDIAFAHLPNIPKKNKELAKKLWDLELQKQVLGEQIAAAFKTHDNETMKNLAPQYTSLQNQEDQMLADMAKGHPVIHVKHLLSNKAPKTLDPSTDPQFNWWGTYVGCEWTFGSAYGNGNAYTNTPWMYLNGGTSTVIYASTPGPWGTTCQPQQYTSQVIVQVEDMLTGETYVSAEDYSGSPTGIDAGTDVIWPGNYNSWNPYSVTILFLYTNGNELEATGQFVA